MLPASIQRNREHPVSVVFGVNDHSGVRPGFGSAAQDVSDPGGHVTFYSAGRITETGCSQTPLQEWYHYDGIGNVATITDDSGQLLTGYDQEAFGTVYGIYDGTYSYQYGGKNGLSVPGIQQEGEHLTTKNYHAATQMYHFNFRWYDPVIGRFIQQEPLGLDGPNQYHFCFNNPVNGYDPNGLQYADVLWDIPYEEWPEEMQAIYPDGFLPPSRPVIPIWDIWRPGNDYNPRQDLFWQNILERVPSIGFSGTLYICEAGNNSSPEGYFGFSFLTLASGSIDVRTRVPLNGANDEIGVNFGIFGIRAALGVIVDDPRPHIFKPIVFHFGFSVETPIYWRKTMQSDLKK